MATNSQARQFAQLISELSPELQRAFMASVTDLQAGVDWSALLAALTAGDVPAAITALHIDDAAFAEYSSAMSSAYAKAGASTAASVGTIGVRFQMTNPTAQEWIRTSVGESITGFTREQVQTARNVIEQGYARGQGPRNIAVDLVGRSVGGGARQGGVLGLDGPRAERLMSVTRGMETADGVRDLVVQHRDGTLGVRYAVNPATEARILRAYRAGTAVSDADRVISERQYSNALLKARADTVARTETANAVMSATFQQWTQMAESGQIDPAAVIKGWGHGRGTGRDFRPAHVALNGHSVRGLFTPFIVDGTPMQYACDPRGGAAQVICCGCYTTFRVDHSVGLE